MRSIFPAIVFALVSLNLGKVSRVNAQTQEDEAVCPKRSPLEAPMNT